MDYTGSGIGLVGKFFIRNVILIFFSRNKIWSNQQRQQKLYHGTGTKSNIQCKDKYKQNKTIKMKNPTRNITRLHSMHLALKFISTF